MTVPLELRNDFNDNRDNSDKHDNNDNDENDNVNSDNLNPHDNSDDLLDKTGLSENRKSKRITAINADIIRSLNDENFEQCFDIMNKKGECRKIYYFRHTSRIHVICT